jgi:hypothetical protein
VTWVPPSSRLIVPSFFWETPGPAFGWPLVSYGGQTERYPRYGRM